MMVLDMASFGLGLAIAAGIVTAWLYGRQSAIRTCRRILRHGRNLDLVFFEDAERDNTVERPKPASAEVSPLHLRQSDR